MLFSDLACCGEQCDDEECCASEDCECVDPEDEDEGCCGDGCLDENCCLRCACDHNATADDLMDRMAVTVPEGVSGFMVIKRVVIKSGSTANWKNKLEGRGTRPGEYTRLVEYENGRNIGTELFGFGDTVWMSDVDAERQDHLPAVRRISQPETKRVLINGLGIGMVLQAALSFDHVRHIDVVESDTDVIKLAGPHYSADSRVHIHHADAYRQGHEWPDGTRWDVIWSDIWPTITTDNAEMMRLLKLIYTDKTAWHGFWSADTMRKKHGVRI
jgi:hypothetical protein